MQKLFDYQNFIFKQIKHRPFFWRDCFDTITLDNRINGIVGHRGVGKTTYLLHRAIQEGAEEGKALYVSADNVYFLHNKLLDLVDQLYRETDIRLVCIDEIHKYPNWDQELKNIADTFLDVTILFSGSSMIDIVRKKYDLSRRATLYHFHGLSFREYLNIYHDQKLSVIKLSELQKSHMQVANSIKIDAVLKHFNTYLRSGYYPFFTSFSQEWEKYQAIQNAAQKTIYEDIATLHSLKTPTLLVMEKLFQFVLSSPPGELSVHKLSTSLGKDFQSITEYLRWMQEAGLLRFLYPKRGSKAFLRNPIKMYPDNTTLIYAASGPRLSDGESGKVRETFALSHLQNAGYSVYYSSRGDFQVDNESYEIGGAQKSDEQVGPNGYVLADSITVGFQKKIPLYLLGLLY